MGIVPQEVKDAQEAAAGTNKYIKASEFEKDGLKLLVKGFEKIRPKNPKFGANDDDPLVEQKILAAGETFRYTFMTVPTEEEIADPTHFPTERMVESKSLALFIAFSQLDPNAGDVIRIKKEGKMEDTRYSVELEN